VSHGTQAVHEAGEKLMLLSSKQVAAPADAEDAGSSSSGGFVVRCIARVRLGSNSVSRRTRSGQTAAFMQFLHGMTLYRPVRRHQRNIETLSSSTRCSLRPCGWASTAPFAWMRGRARHRRRLPHRTRLESTASAAAHARSPQRCSSRCRARWPLGGDRGFNSVRRRRFRAIAGHGGWEQPPLRRARVLGIYRPM
jgi:hypothetical protein